MNQKKEKMQINQRQKGDITIDTTKIKIIRRYIENLYANIFKTLDSYDLPKLNQEDILKN
jgi:hypothetical protein